MFPREIEHLTMNTFRPPEVTPDFHQSGMSVGVQDRFAPIADDGLESTLAGRWFEINVNTDGRGPMIYTPETQPAASSTIRSANVRSLQWVETLSLSVDNWRGQHLFKFGFDFQDSRYNGMSTSRPVEIRRLDGSLAERIVLGAADDAAGRRRRARAVRAGSLADRIARHAGARACGWIAKT